MYKPIYRYDIEQNSDEWLEIKIGKFSASNSAPLLMDKNTKGYTGLINKIIEERLTGLPCENDSFKGNAFTNRGHEFEPIARNDFEIDTLQVVNLVGVVELNDWVLCSPDGLINDDKLHQIKCPIFSTQRKYLELVKNGKCPIDTNYYKQMQFELFVTQRESNIFTSFHPKLKRIDYVLKRDEKMISFIETRLSEAKKEVLEQIQIIKNY